ncbi:phage tail protein, partial [Escherichia coli]|nr:phage tail protein [Escherichia coli]MEA0099548.1 phage tail protein [Escherichia coli]
DRNRSHWSTSKTPSYTKSVSWQHHPNGLNHSLRVFTCDFKVEANERDSFEKFLARHEGYKSFFWRPPGINRKIRVVCRTWSATEHITYTDFSCQFDEVVI